MAGFVYVGAIPGPQGDQGPKGDPGTPGSAAYKVAEEPISALQALYAVSPTNVGVADNTVDGRDRFHSVALSAALTGETILVQELGEIIDPFFQFDTGSPLWLGPLGAITDAPPDAGKSILLAEALGAGGIVVRSPLTVVL